MAGETPALEPFIPADFKTATAASRARAIDPDASGEIEAYNELADLYQQQVGALRAAIREHAGPAFEAEVPVDVLDAE